MSARFLAPAAWAVASMLGCAEGTTLPAVIEQGISGDAGEPGDLLTLGAPGAGSGPEVSEPDAAVPAELAGDPCMQGAVEVCTCVELGTEGQRHCVFDVSSPLDGFFSDCEQCPEPPPEPELPDAGASSADSGAMAETPAGAGAGGVGGGVAPPPPAASGCLANPGMCTALLQCCRQDGMCGLGLPGVLCL